MDKDKNNSCMTARTPIMGVGKASRLANSNEYVITSLTTLECSDGKIRVVPERLLGKLMKQDELFQVALTSQEELDFVGYVKHSFGKALEFLKEGRKVARVGWNGKGMFIVRQKGYPDGIECNKNTSEAFGIEEGTIIKVTPYLMMKAADGTLVTGWLASQTDMLAEDWILTDGKS